MVDPILKQLSGGKLDTTQTGVIGIIVMILGIVGSIIIPTLSDKDKLQRRKIYILTSNIIGACGLGLLLVVSGFGGMSVVVAIYGFFAVGSSPVLITYSAEVAFPTSEGTSAGLMFFGGNLAGALFLSVNYLFNGNYFFTMLMLLALSVVSIDLLWRQRKSKA